MISFPVCAYLEACSSELTLIAMIVYPRMVLINVFLQPLRCGSNMSAIITWKSSTVVFPQIVVFQFEPWSPDIFAEIAGMEHIVMTALFMFFHVTGAGGNKITLVTFIVNIFCVEQLFGFVAAHRFWNQRDIFFYNFERAIKLLTINKYPLAFDYLLNVVRGQYFSSFIPK